MSPVKASELAALRIEYEAAGIDPVGMAADPFDEFSEWFAAAIDAGVEQPNTFVLATATTGGMPSARAVLMKEFSREGVAFYTNTRSRKGHDLETNPRAAACFVWLELHRQVRIEGDVSRVDNATADAYFETRPPGSRVSAAVSPQSEVVESRDVLERLYAELEEAHPGGAVPRPPHWGGYRIVPDMFEFWQGRPHRFHDRVRYRREAGAWIRERLAP